VEFRFKCRLVRVCQLSPADKEAVMQDMLAHLEKLLTDAEDCALISKLADDKAKRELFAKLSVHLKQLASEVERTIREKQANEEA
jgi:hypothetical protein